ncbi:Hypothetical predicted protein [Lecanosticta acicola]|uniref:Zn(2)-C6 fungal-type domain-containing protein n=1 Tax=Lecanosticta acicola TaxID=111012 RepID=A0AAI8YW22_9PEZI|nr:Hypothetical predicted protein [Lecanosticta acicola]
MSLSKAQQAIPRRCERCKQTRKGCNRGRPCARCIAAGIGYEGCVPAVDGRNPGKRATKKADPASDDVETEQEEEDIQVPSSSYRARGQDLTSLAGSVTRTPLTEENFNTPATPRRLEIRLQPPASVPRDSYLGHTGPALVTDANGTAHLQLAPSGQENSVSTVLKDKLADEQRNKMPFVSTSSATMALQTPSKRKAQEALQPNFDEKKHVLTPSAQSIEAPGPRTTHTLRSALDLANEQGFQGVKSWENEESGRQYIDPSKLLRHDRHEGKYFIHGTAWFNRYGICMECEESVDQHLWWCSECRKHPQD